MGQVGYGEALGSHAVPVERDADSSRDAEDDPFGNQFGLAVAIFAPVIAAYCAIGYGIYLAWGALT